MESRVLFLDGLPQVGPNPIVGQHGFHGTVASPTLFLAGEAGRERVDITSHSERTQKLRVTVNLDRRKYAEQMTYEDNFRGC